MARWGGVIAAYRAFLPLEEKTPIVTLDEGNTPLILAQRLSEVIHPNVTIYFKCEGHNPTGSFKDRGMSVAISHAVGQGTRAVICASTGNTSASAAAYGARAGLPVCVVIPEGEVALGKLAQARIHGATVIQVKENFDHALRIVKDIAANHPIQIVNSINPFRIEGQKTAAFEVCDQLGEAPTYHFLPVGNAGNIRAYWKGYREYYDHGRIKTLPKMVGFQAAGAAPIVQRHVVNDPQTVATAIRIGNPANWREAEKAVEESSGAIDIVTDQEILDAYRTVAEREGIFCEPASAAAVAGMMKVGRAGMFHGGDRIVCTLTGHGLKDVDRALAVAPYAAMTCSSAKEVADAVRAWM